MPYQTYHIISRSPWPVLGSLVAFVFLRGIIFAFHITSWPLFTLGLLMLIALGAAWWRDIVREAILGSYTLKLREGLSLGVLLFICSELIFFFSFFWAYFHRRLVPAHEIGCLWPPAEVYPLNAFRIPLLNTSILLASRATITWAHHGIILQTKCEALWGMWSTVILALYFMALQWGEYDIAFYGINDSVFGSTFFLCTGFHGLHVLVGAGFIIVIWARALLETFSCDRHLGLESAAWYWHFVDVVWIFLYTALYWWASI